MGIMELSSPFRNILIIITIILYVGRNEQNFTHPLIAPEAELALEALAFIMLALSDGMLTTEYLLMPSTTTRPADMIT